MVRRRRRSCSPGDGGWQEEDLHLHTTPQQTLRTAIAIAHRTYAETTDKR